MSDWAEIRRLQAEFERVQASSAAFKLSEVNCVEIVKKLTEMNLLNILFTLDGKEYVVPEHLEREIMNEVEANNGRINVVELQQILNVDLNHIQRCVDSLLKHHETLQLISGEIITESYQANLCTEINEILLQSGFISLADLSTNFTLPLSFVTQCVENALNVTISGQLDKSGSGLLYTDSYVSRHRARLRGLFSAITRPTPIAPLVNDGKYHERLFHSVLHELISSEEIAGVLHGRGLKAMFIPSVYSQMQSQWVDNFLTDNGYLEYDGLVRLGIEDPQTYIRQRYKERDDLKMLSTCCIGSTVSSEVAANVEDNVLSQLKWIDIMTVLPSPCVEEDGELLLQELYSKQENLFISGTIVAHREFIGTCLEHFQSLIEERAKKAAANSGSFLRQVSQDGAKGGEGKRGRQKKGKGRREREEEDSSSNWEVIFMSKEEIERTLSDKLDDLPDTFANSLANILWRPLQERFEVEARQLLAAKAEGEAGSQRKRHSVLQEGLQELWNRVKLFEKGIGLFEGDLKVQLSKYLLHTLCTDMANQLIGYIAEDYKITVPEDTESFNKERSKIVSKFSDPLKKLASSVNSSLSNKEVTGFLVSFESLCEAESCGIMLRKLEKKKEKQLIFTHQQTLKASLQDEQEPAMALHLVTVLLFQLHTGCLLHTPGRLLPQIITFMASLLEHGDFSKLNSYQSLVVLELKMSSSSEKKPTEAEEKESVLEIDSKLFEDELEVAAKDDTLSVEAPDTSANGDRAAAKEESVDIRLQLMSKLDELKDLVLKKKSSN